MTSELNVEHGAVVSKLTKTHIRKLRELSKRDLYVFAKGVLGFDWLVPHIHLPVCNQLQRYKTLIRQGFILPRGWLKTTVCSEAYPLWRAIRDPNFRSLLVQNTFTNAVQKLGVIKKIVEQNELFRALFPEILPNKTCTWKAEALCLNRPGTYDTSTFEAAGVWTQVTSRHYDLITEDDTVAPELDDLGESNLCPKKEDVDQAIGWHRLVTPLLVSPGESQNIVVGTRWFEKDLLSWVKANEPQFAFISRACLENSNGEADENGKITYKERFDKKVLEGLRASLGPYMFSCLYLNKPVRSTDMVFQPEWVQYYETPPKDLICYTTVDPAGDPADSKGKPDFNVVLTCGKCFRTGRVYVLEYKRERCSPGRLLDMLFDQVVKWNPVKVGLETTQYQKSLKYWIKEKSLKENVFFEVQSLTHTKRSKFERIKGLQPVFSNGMILIKSHMTVLLNEMLAFPLGEFDDVLDDLASQLELWGLSDASKTREIQQNDVDPLSIDLAIKELKHRAKRNSGDSRVFDVYRTRDTLSFN